MKNIVNDIETKFLTNRFYSQFFYRLALFIVNKARYDSEDRRFFEAIVSETEISYAINICQWPQLPNPLRMALLTELSTLNVTNETSKQTITRLWIQYEKASSARPATSAAAAAMYPSAAAAAAYPEVVAEYPEVALPAVDFPAISHADIPAALHPISEIDHWRAEVARLESELAQAHERVRNLETQAAEHEAVNCSSVSFTP